MTYRFRDYLLLRLPDLKGNPAVTQRERRQRLEVRIGNSSMKASLPIRCTVQLWGIKEACAGLKVNRGRI